jgi:hypothetical protein
MYALRLRTPVPQGRYFLLARQKNFPVLFSYSNPFRVVTKLSHPGRRW